MSPYHWPSLPLQYILTINNIYSGLQSYSQAQHCMYSWINAPINNRSGWRQSEDVRSILSSLSLSLLWVISCCCSHYAMSVMLVVHPSLIDSTEACSRYAHTLVHVICMLRYIVTTVFISTTDITTSPIYTYFPISMWWVAAMQGFVYVIANGDEFHT